MPIDVKIGKLKGKAYTKEEYLFKKAHPFRWWLGTRLIKLFTWIRKVRGKDLYIKDLK